MKSIDFAVSENIVENTKVSAAFVQELKEAFLMFPVRTDMRFKQSSKGELIITKSTIDMEDMFSLGSVILWNNIQCGNDGATDGEVAELFVSKVLGSVVLKLKYEDIVYAVSNDDIHPIIFTANTLKGKKYFIYENFRILKRNIEAIKSE